MSFRISRGVWQFKKEDGTFESKYKISTDGRLVETDASGNEVSTFGGSVAWSAITGIPTTFTPSSHTHDDRYYTESEVNTLLAGKQAAGSYITSNAALTAITTGAWAGAAGYHGYTYTGGNYRFGFSSTSGVVDVYADGNFYAQEGAKKLATEEYVTTRGYITGYSETDTLATVTARGATTSSRIYADNGVHVRGDWVRVNGTTGLYFESYGGGWNMSDSTWIRAYNNKSIYTAGTVQAARFEDANNSGYYLDPASSSNLNGISARQYYQALHGEPRNNLGDPTVTDMALFDAQFNNKTERYPASKVKFFTSSDGTNFSEFTGFTDVQKQRLLTGDDNSGVYIPNLTNRFRIELDARGYTFVSMMYLYWSSNSHSTKIHVWIRRCDNQQWYQHTSSDTYVSSWPGHVTLPFPSVAWLEGNTTSSGHFDKIRIEFIPSWSGHATYGGNVISLDRLQLWGGYPAGKRNVFHTNYLSEVTFPSNVYTNSGKLATESYVTSQGYITSSASISGNAATATKLATARNIALSGDVSGSANFDGSGNITITATVADDSHNHVISNIDGLQAALDGKQAAGSYLTTSGKAADSNLLDGLDNTEFARGRASYQVLSLDSFKQPGLYQYGGGITGTQPEGTNQANLRTIEIGSQNRYSQVAFDWASDQAWFRRHVDAGWQPWREFIHSGNIGSQSVNYANSAGAVAWGNVSGKPSTFTPSSHTHAISDVTGLQTALNGKQAAGSYAAASHTHTIAQVTGLQTALDGKQAAGSYASASHEHTWTSILSRPTRLSDFTNDLGNYGGFLTSIPTHNLSSHTNDGTYNIFDSWLRENGDNNNFRIYGNSRMVIFRTDGTAGGEGHTGYPFNFRYGGDATSNTLMLLNTGGNVWTKSYGWLHTRKWASASSADTATNVNNGNVYTTGNNLYIQNSGVNNYRVHHNGSDGVFDVKYKYAVRNMDTIWSAQRVEWGDWMAFMWFDVDPWGDNWGIGGNPRSWKTVNRGSFLTFGFEDWSDRRSKSAIIEIDNAAEKVKAIGGYTYWKIGSEVREAGVIAQDVLAVFPEAIGGTEDGYSVKPAALIGLLMKAVKEQQETIESLTARIEQLENR